MPLTSYALPLFLWMTKRMRFNLDYLIRLKGLWWHALSVHCQCVQGQRCTQPLFTYVGLIYGSGRFTLCPFVTCSVSDASGFVSLSSWLMHTGTQTLWSLLPKRHCLWPFQCKRNPYPSYTQTIFTQNWIGLDLTGPAECTLNFSFSFFFQVLERLW